MRRVWVAARSSLCWASPRARRRRTAPLPLSSRCSTVRRVLSVVSPGRASFSGSTRRQSIQLVGSSLSRSRIPLGPIRTAGSRRLAARHPDGEPNTPAWHAGIRFAQAHEHGVDGRRSTRAARRDRREGEGVRRRVAARPAPSCVEDRAPTGVQRRKRLVRDPAVTVSARLLQRRAPRRACRSRNARARRARSGRACGRWRRVPPGSSRRSARP